VEELSLIYADNAATTMLDFEAFEAMKPYFFHNYGNASQAYSFARPAKKALRQARKTIAACIGAFPEEIYFTSGGTESNNWVIKGVPSLGDRGGIITSVVEHHAILHACNSMERSEIPVIYMPVEKTGVVLPKTLEGTISSKTKLVSVMMVNNEIGTIEPITDLCRITHEHGALFHTDAVQAVGHLSIDVHELDIDMLSASAHKFNGPKGIGFLYVKNGVKINSLLDGGNQEFGMRSGTENIASIVAMAVALKNNCDGMEKNRDILQKLESLFLHQLQKADIDYIQNGGRNHIPGNISISIKNAEGEMLLHRLDLKGICVSTGSACNSKSTQVSHVIKAIGVPEEYEKGTIRISLSKDNTEQDMLMIANALIEILGA